jgi:transcriptional regulator with XRE-family HTH domain
VNLAERISTLRRVNGLSARQLAALVDIAPTTVTRIEAGSVSPSFDLAQELLVVLGESVTVTGFADRDAIVAARLALDPSLAGEKTNGVQAWRERWARIGLVDDSGVVVAGRRSALLLQASIVTRLTRRTGAIDFLPTASVRELTEALQTAGLGYALTGDSAANLYSPSAGELWPVLYVENVLAAASASGLTARGDGQLGHRITLIPFDGICELARVEIDGISVAALDQVVLDCYGGIGRMPEQADALMRRAA